MSKRFATLIDGVVNEIIISETEVAKRNDVFEIAEKVRTGFRKIGSEFQPPEPKEIKIDRDRFLSQFTVDEIAAMNDKAKTDSTTKAAYDLVFAKTYIEPELANTFRTLAKPTIKNNLGEGHM